MQGSSMTANTAAAGAVDVAKRGAAADPPTPTPGAATAGKHVMLIAAGDVTAPDAGASAPAPTPAGAIMAMGTGVAPAAALATAAPTPAATDAAATMPLAAMPAAGMPAPMPAAATPAAAAPTAAVPAAAAPVPVTVYSIGPLRDSKGPIQLDAAGYATVARLRGQLAASTAAEDAAPDDAARAAAAAKSRFLRQQLAAVQAGFLDASAIAADDSATPLCVVVGRQCGGLQPGSNTDPWQGISACCGNSTCVQTDPNFAQCVPIAEVRKQPPPLPAASSPTFFGGAGTDAPARACAVAVAPARVQRAERAVRRRLLGRAGLLRHRPGLHVAEPRLLQVLRLQQAVGAVVRPAARARLRMGRRVCVR